MQDEYKIRKILLSLVEHRVNFLTYLMLDVLGENFDSMRYELYL